MVEAFALTPLRSATVFSLVFAAFSTTLLADPALAALHTYGGSDSISHVEVVEVYFLPKGRVPMPDWRDRLTELRAKAKDLLTIWFSGKCVITRARHYCVRRTVQIPRLTSFRSLIDPFL